jgi:hypothetical protein
MAWRSARTLLAVLSLALLAALLRQTIAGPAQQPHIAAGGSPDSQRRAAPLPTNSVPIPPTPTAARPQPSGTPAPPPLSSQCVPPFLAREIREQKLALSAQLYGAEAANMGSEYLASLYDHRINPAGDNTACKLPAIDRQVVKKSPKEW